MASYQTAASHVTLHANVCPMWHIFKFFTEITNGYGKTSNYKHFPHTHVQNTYNEIAQLQQVEYKVCTFTNVRLC